MGFGGVWVLSFGEVVDLLIFMVEHDIWEKDIDLIEKYKKGSERV